MRAFHRQIGIDQIPHPLGEGIHQLGDKAGMGFELLGVRTEIREGLIDVVETGLDVRHHRSRERHRAQAGSRRDRHDRATNTHILGLQGHCPRRIGIGEELHSIGDRTIEQIGAVEFGILDNHADLVEQGLEIGIIGLTRIGID